MNWGLMLFTSLVYDLHEWSPPPITPQPHQGEGGPTGGAGGLEPGFHQGGGPYL